MNCVCSPFLFSALLDNCIPQSLEEQPKPNSSLCTITEPLLLWFSLHYGYKFKLFCCGKCNVNRCAKGKYCQRACVLGLCSDLGVASRVPCNFCQQGGHGIGTARPASQLACVSLCSNFFICFLYLTCIFTT